MISNRFSKPFIFVSLVAALAFALAGCQSDEPEAPVGGPGTTDATKPVAAGGDGGAQMGSATPQAPPKGPDGGPH